MSWASRQLLLIGITSLFLAACNLNWQTPSIKGCYLGFVAYRLDTTPQIVILGWECEAPNQTTGCGAQFTGSLKPDTYCY